MLVAATHRGFFVKLREPGQQFDVPDAAFSARWMKRIESAVVAEPETPLVTEPATPVVAPVVKKRRGRKPKAVSE